MPIQECFPAEKGKYAFMLEVGQQNCYVKQWLNN